MKRRKKKRRTHDNDDDGDNDEKFVCICVHAHLILMMIALTSLRSLNVFSAVQFLCNTHIHIGAKPPLRLFRSPAHSRPPSVSLARSLFLPLFGLYACNAMQSQTHCVTVCRYGLRSFLFLYLFLLCACLSHLLLLWHEGISTNRLEHIRLAIILLFQRSMCIGVIAFVISAIAAAAVAAAVVFFSLPSSSLPSPSLHSMEI